jgi:hypothetical protein
MLSEFILFRLKGSKVSAWQRNLGRFATFGVVLLAPVATSFLRSGSVWSKLTIGTLWLNAAVMVVFFAIIVVTLQILLRRQLTKV